MNTFELSEKFDWHHTSLGDPDAWSSTLRNMISLCMNSKMPTLILWGKDLIQVYNDSYRILIGNMHPEAFGSRANENWKNYWTTFEPMLSDVLRNGKSYYLQNQPLNINRKGYVEECYFTFSYSPIFDGAVVVGIFVQALDTTDLNIGKYRVEENEQRQREALEAADIGTFDLDMTTNSLLYSGKLSEIFGFTKDEHPAYEDILTRIHPDDRAKREHAMAAAVNTGLLLYEVRIQWPDHINHWIRVTGKVFYDNTGKPVRIYGTAIDITKAVDHEHTLKNALQEQSSAIHQKNIELKSNEARYHKMIDEIQDYAIILLDKDGIIQNWNKGAEKIEQYKEREAVGRSSQIFYLPQDRVMRLPERLLEEASLTGRATHEGWRLRKDQTRFWGSVTVTAIHGDHDDVIGFAKIIRDLTPQKIAEDESKKLANDLRASNEELKKNEERYQRMIQEVEDYAIIMLDENGIIQNWNRGTEKIKLYREHEIVGKHFREFYLPHDRESGLPERLIEQARKTGKAGHEGWRVRRDGTTFWGNITITALHDANNNVIGFSKVTRDLTERKAAEDRLWAYAQELETQNKELERFAFVASHDLQEPLRKIRTFADLIQYNFDNRENIELYLSKINSSALRMSELIRSILNYSKVSHKREEPKPVDLNVVLKNIETDFELIIREKKAKIISDTLPVINGIPIQISQLFANLISNALKFSTENPVITITSRTVSPEALPEHADRPAHTRYLEISVADNGIGFEQKYDKKIFTMFQRLHNSSKFSGTGIGLALCQRIMENHEGFITVKSELGKGSTFHTYFPI